MEPDEIASSASSANSANNAVVKLRHGSVLNLQDLRLLDSELKAMQGELDRARRLAAKLEEVVAMRTAIVRALVEWRTADGKAGSETQLNGIVSWAYAQLSEIP